MSKWIVILHDAADATANGRARLRQHFVQQFGLSTEAAARVFNSLPVVIRRDLSREKAEAFMAVLERCGGVAEMIEYNGQLNLPDMGITMPDEDIEAGDLQLQPQSAFDESLEKLETQLEVALQEAQHVAEEDYYLQPENSSKQVDATKQPVVFEIENYDNEPAPPRGISHVFEDAESTLASGTNGVGGPTPSLKVTAVSDAPPEPVIVGDESNVNHGPSVPIFAGVFQLPATYAHPGAAASNALTPSPTSLVETPASKLGFTSFNKKKLMIASATLAVAFCILIVGMPYFFGTTARMEMKIDVEALLRAQNEILHATSTTNIQSELPKKVWTSEVSADGITANLVLLEIDKQVVQAGLEFSTSMPPKRSIEEIANKVKPPVWLRRFLAKGITGFMVEAPRVDGQAQSFSLSGLGKAYLSDEISSERVVVPLEVNGHWDAAENCWVGVWRLTKNIEDSGPSATSDAARTPVRAGVERLPSNEFRLYLEQKFSTKSQ